MQKWQKSLLGGFIGGISAAGVGFLLFSSIGILIGTIIGSAVGALVVIVKTLIDNELLDRITECDSMKM